MYCPLVKFYQASQHAENLHATGFYVTASSVESYLHLKTIAIYMESHTSSWCCSKLRHRIATWNQNKEVVHFFIGVHNSLTLQVMQGGSSDILLVAYDSLRAPGVHVWLRRCLGC